MAFLDRNLVMNKIDIKELKKINGGGLTLSATLIASIIKGIDVIFEVGRSLGSVIRRSQSNNICPM